MPKRSSICTSSADSSTVLPVCSPWYFLFTVSNLCNSFVLASSISESFLDSSFWIYSLSKRYISSSWRYCSKVFRFASCSSSCFLTWVRSTKSCSLLPLSFEQSCKLRSKSLNAVFRLLKFCCCCFCLSLASCSSATSFSAITFNAPASYSPSILRCKALAPGCHFLL